MKASILIGALVFGLISVRSTQAIDEAIQLDEIQMMEESSGWAVQNREIEIVSAYLLHSDDAGQTWQDVTPDSERPSLVQAQDVQFEFLNAAEAWAYYPPELWFTNDAGESWTLIGEFGDAFHSYFLDFVDEEQGWLLQQDCCAAGNELAWLFRSEDGGASWEIINSADDNNTRRDLGTMYHTDMDFADEELGWITISSVTNFGGILVTEDGGESWELVELLKPDGSEPPPEYGGFVPSCLFVQAMVFSSDSFAALAICDVESENPPYGLGAYVYTTDDRGETWDVIELPIPVTSHYDYLALDMLSTDIIWTTSAGDVPLYRTVDGGETWETLADLQFSPTFRLNFLNEELGWAIDGNHDLLKTTDGGESWEMLYPQMAENP